MYAEVKRVFLAKSSFSTRNQANFVFKLLLKIDKVGVTFENTEIRAKNCGEITPFENLSTLISERKKKRAELDPRNLHLLLEISV